MKLKYKILEFDNGYGYCTSLREENLYTGEVKWFDVDDGVRYPNNDIDRKEKEYKQFNREEKLKQLDL